MIWGGVGAGVVSPCQQVFHMSNQESLHYRLQMYVIYPLKLWVKSILKDKKQTAIKKKKKEYTKKLSVSPKSPNNVKTLFWYYL